MNSDEILARAGLSLTEGMYVNRELSFMFGQNERKIFQALDTNNTDNTSKV